MVSSSSSSSSNSILRSLFNSTSKLTSSYSKLSSGQRINSAKDDAAGLAIVAALTADSVVLSQGSRNASDGLSMASIAESGISAISDITIRQAELAEQSANGTLSDSQRVALNEEFQALESEKSRILSTTTFNGVNVFEGVTLQVGTDGSSGSRVSISAVDVSTLTNSSLDLLSQGSARTALDGVKTQISSAASKLGEIGSVVSRIDSAIQNNGGQRVESLAAASRIKDLDVASEAADLVSSKIQQKASVAMLGQANNLNSSLIKDLVV